MVIWHPNVAVGDLGYREREPVTSAGAREQANSSTQERCDIVYVVLCLAIKSHHCTWNEIWPLKQYKEYDLYKNVYIWV